MANVLPRVFRFPSRNMPIINGWRSGYQTPTKVNQSHSPLSSSGLKRYQAWTPGQGVYFPFHISAHKY